MIWKGNKKLAEKMRVMSNLKMGVFNMAIANASKLSAMWKKVTPITASFSNIPEGDYIGDLKEMVLGNAKKGRLQVVVNWEVADGEQAGQTQKQFYGLSDDKGNPDETGMGYFKNVCEIIGLDLPDDVEAWQETMNQFLADNPNVLYDITAKANGNYTNVFINQVSEFTKGEEGGEAAEGEELEVAEVVEEEVVEEVEEEVQQVVAPVRRTVAVTKPVAKVAAKPVAKVAVTPTKMSAAPGKKMVTLTRR